MVEGKAKMMKMEKEPQKVEYDGDMIYDYDVKGRRR